MLLVYTGNGKGKTTAALGAAMRAVGEGKRVLMIQFIKGPWKSGEDTAQEFLYPHFKILKKGRGFVGILGDALPRSAHEEAARDAIDTTRREVRDGGWDAVILDEINNAVQLNLVNADMVIELLDEIEPHLEFVILTGRDANEAFLARADLITEMREQKHPFAAGKKARRGIEY